MPDSYSRKYQIRSGAKPECYGDADMYDPEDRVCKDCTVRRACKVAVDKELQKIVRESRRTKRTRRDDDVELVFQPKANKDRTAPEEDDTFFGALFYNGSLSAMKAVLLEAHHGVDSIPHVRYPNPFKRLRKIKSQEDDE